MGRPPLPPKLRNWGNARATEYSPARATGLTPAATPAETLPGRLLPSAYDGVFESAIVGLGDVSPVSGGALLALPPTMNRGDPVSTGS